MSVTIYEDDDNFIKVLDVDGLPILWVCQDGIRVASSMTVDQAVALRAALAPFVPQSSQTVAVADSPFPPDYDTRRGIPRELFVDGPFERLKHGPAGYGKWNGESSAHNEPPERFWRVDEHYRGGWFWYCVDREGTGASLHGKSGESFCSLVRATREFAEADGRASGLPEWPGPRGTGGK